ncbi:acyl transferase/acyl hydrolase/lysophospholipase [Chytridium lagenaria]|nr:acyl transferase/acyl hydrolase/lysophospholipase [Chytridium lagenaria]
MISGLINYLLVGNRSPTACLEEEIAHATTYEEWYEKAKELDIVVVCRKTEFINDTRQSFGNSALVLLGGATFGLYHLGVVKALNEHRVLPRIICGSSVGALIASLVCIHTDDELPRVFEPGGTKGNARRKITRFLKHGYLMDVKVLEDCVRSNVGDLTFEVWPYVSHDETSSHITVSSSRKNEVPRLLNYLTAPNVLIWSAACASAHVIGLYDTVDLLAKDKTGNIVHWSPTAIRWADASSDTESPENRLAELFNVNHFIVSQANPYIYPLQVKGHQTLNEGLLGRFGHSQLGLIPSFAKPLLHQGLQGHVTIAPELSSSDIYTLFSNPTYDSVSYWVLKGEQSTWPFLAFIRNRTMIEMALDRCYRKLKRLDDRSHTTLFEDSNRARALSIL